MPLSGRRLALQDEHGSDLTEQDAHASQDSLSTVRPTARGIKYQPKV
jgi:hypothetical protein